MKRFQMAMPGHVHSRYIFAPQAPGVLIINSRVPPRKVETLLRLVNFELPPQIVENLNNAAHGEIQSQNATERERGKNHAN